jgi:hypothetical protein
MIRILVYTLAAASMAQALMGCGGTTAVGGVPGLPVDFTGTGSYTVPAVPTVTFAVSEVRIEQTAGNVNLYYDLPADLVGRETSVELTGALDASGAIQLSGDAGTSTCTVATGRSAGPSPAGLLSCKEDLSGIKVDPPHGNESDAQRAAVEAFITDPIGVLDVPLPP